MITAWKRWRLETHVAHVPRKFNASPTQVSRTCHASFTQVPRKLHARPTQFSRTSHASFAQVPRKLHARPTQFSHKSHASFAQVPRKLHARPTQFSRTSHASFTQVPRKFRASPTQALIHPFCKGEICPCDASSGSVKSFLPHAFCYLMSWPSRSNQNFSLAKIAIAISLYEFHHSECRGLALGVVARTPTLHKEHETGR